MASFKKDGNVWRVQVARRGVRLSGSFPTKKAAEAWAVERENEIMKGTYSGAGSRTVADLFDEYAKRVSDGKAGGQWERTRFKAFKKNFPDLAAKLLTETNSHDWGLWRDERLQTVSAGTLIREANLFSAAFHMARREWKWIDKSPMTDMRRPKEPQARDRRISANEEGRLTLALGYAPGNAPETISARVALIVQFAIETAARASEITGLTWDRVHERHFHLDKTKTGVARDVAMSARAREIIEEVRAVTGTQQTVFEVPSASLDALFRKAKKRCGIEDLHFHDTRHEAITRLAKKIDVLDLARMVGHRDLRMLQVYYNESAHDMAAKLG
ncbi:site-specific integrase [Paraburkholderia tropica]|uniref:site-specific integrase n=1 Tax=Paraburkholderia tropica TaxID=92647 RepID=UPI002AB18E3B|nr:site-specific integrase [Paraburkholderia tropica]